MRKQTKQATSAQGRRLQRVVRQTRRELKAANDMLERIMKICDEAGIPRVDNSEPPYQVQFCEGHRVKLLAERDLRNHGERYRLERECMKLIKSKKKLLKPTLMTAEEAAESIRKHRRLLFA